MKGEKTADMKKIGITDTTLRDSHQSLLATRLKTEDMLPIAAKMDEVGFHSMEVWGGATFDTCMRFLNEDPWERLDRIRGVVKKTNLQMLLRGQNLVGYKHYADDVVEEFVKKAAAHGIDIFRIFDAMNDVRNLYKSIEVAKKEKAHVQATMCYTISPVHNLDYFIKLAGEMADLGADSICIKDMAGILKPYAVEELVQELKKNINLPLQIHTHYTSGMASMMYIKAIEAGADAIDTAFSAMALGTSQPPTESMVAALQGSSYDTGLNLAALTEISEYFKEIRKKYIQYDVYTSGVDTNVLLYQVPGGMLSNFITQLKEQNAGHRLNEVLQEVPRVRKDMGYPPLVTPTSQIVGTQAVMNVLLGRYKMVTNEVKAYFKGSYGATPGPVNEEIRDMIIKDQELITRRPADFIEPQMEQARREIGIYLQKEEDVLSYALFPQVAKQFLEERYAAKTNVDYKIAHENEKSMGVKVYPL